MTLRGLPHRVSTLRTAFFCVALAWPGASAAQQGEGAPLPCDGASPTRSDEDAADPCGSPTSLARRLADPRESPEWRPAARRTHLEAVPVDWTVVNAGLSIYSAGRALALIVASTGLLDECYLGGWDCDAAAVHFGVTFFPLGGGVAALFSWADYPSGPWLPVVMLGALPAAAVQLIGIVILFVGLVSDGGVAVMSEDGFRLAGGRLEIGLDAAGAILRW